MTQIFSPGANTLSKVTIFGTLALLATSLWAWDAALRSPYMTQVGVVRGQPVAFSHAHHVAGLGLDCRYCHTAVEESASAGIPSTKVCMTCHSQVWSDAPILEPVRESWRTDRPLEWTRVHDLPDFAYFDHSIHVKKGIGCAECHGRVDEMPLMWAEAPLTMDWCVQCHRDPGARIRPRAEVFRMDWDAGELDPEARAALLREYHVQSLTDCSTCHR
jgi:hypothetical protein